MEGFINLEFLSKGSVLEFLFMAVAELKVSVKACIFRWVLKFITLD
jgi:hypothetical protein